jgi:hypothetical protein
VNLSKHNTNINVQPADDNKARRDYLILMVLTGNVKGVGCGVRGRPRKLEQAPE